MRFVVGAAVVLAFLMPGAAGESAAQDPPVRLEGTGKLGPEATPHRGTMSEYGYEGTPHSVVPAMIELAGVTKDDVVYEPGCGDARIVIAAAKAGARKGLGVEIDPDWAEESFQNVKNAGLEDRIEIRWGNALDVDLSQFTVVFLFMGEGFNMQMRPLLWRQLPLGARIVSNDFGMKDWTPDKTVSVRTPDREYLLYLWTITPEIKAKARQLP